MESLISKIRKNKRTIFIVFLLCIVFGLFINIDFVFALSWGQLGTGISNTAGNAIALILALIAYIITAVLGLLTTVLIKILVSVANFNNIIGVETVRIGWTAVRDICNMFFILLLLVIAFATILRIESYNVKKTLPKLLIMAVLINFSKTIFGLIIDFAQVIMLTFTSAFANGHGMFVMLFNIDILGKVSETGQSVSALDSWATVMSIIAGVLASIITLIVVAVMLAVLVFRVVMLWVYTILSPLVFLGFAFPPLQKYVGRIWEDFIKQVMIGPILAFFIWLALTTVDDSAKNVGTMNTDSSTAITVGASAFFEDKDLQRYIITIALLIGGLMVAQGMGGAAGSIAGKGMAWAKGAARLPLRGGKALGGFGIDKISEKAKVDLNVFRGYKRLKTQMEDNKRVRETKIHKGAVEKAKEGGFGSRLALASTGDVAWQNITKWNKGKNIKRLFMGGKWASKFRGKAEDAEEKRKKIWSNKEKTDEVEKMAKKRERLQDFEQKIDTQDVVLQLASDQDKEKEGRKLDSFKKQRDSLKSEITDSMKEFNEKEVDDEEATKLDKVIEDNKKFDKDYDLMGASTAIAKAEAEIEASEQKNIAHIDNADQLGRILIEAMKSGNQGLIAATSKKMTRLGDYNEMNKQLGLGTGHKGMLGLAKKFEDEGGFSQQGSLGLVAEIGGIAKNIQHYGAYGAVKMQNGRWTKASEDEYEQTKLAEMLKLEPQAFARNVNRLGLGHYTGPEQTIDNWEISKATTAFLKLNSAAIANSYKDRGQQNALEHLAGRIGMLEKAEVPPIVIETIQTRVQEKTGADVEKIIKSIKT